jgi:hypothetical protein
VNSREYAFEVVEIYGVSDAACEVEAVVDVALKMASECL